MKTEKVKVEEAWIDENEWAFKRTDAEIAEVQNDFHGDHDIDWLIVFDAATGKEVRRYNAERLLVIVWEKEK